jgi:hypothetical protein
MKKIFSVIFFSLSIIVKAQVWGPATPFPQASGGMINNYTVVNSLCEFNNELYVGGNFTSIGGIVAHCIARWNGNSWNSLGAGNFLQNTILTDIIIYNGSLYFTADKLYKWDGLTIQDFTYFNSSYQTMKPVLGSDLHVYNNQLYIVSGYGGLLKYDGNNFIEIPDNNQIGLINCVDNFNNSIYVGSSQGLFKYDSGSWINCNGVTTITPEIIDMENFNNELYVLGPSSIGGLAVNGFAKYNGATWSNISLPEGYFPIMNTVINNYYTNHLKVINNELFLAFKFGTAQQATFNPSPVLKFNGNQWLGIASNYSQSGGGECVEKYNGSLFCGGDFGYFNNFPLNDSPIEIGFLAKLQGAVSIEESQNQQIQITPNPTSDKISIRITDNLLNQYYKVTDQFGRIVLESCFEFQENQIDLSRLESGMYYLKIEGKEETFKILKY